MVALKRAVLVRDRQAYKCTNRFPYDATLTNNKTQIKMIFLFYSKLFKPTDS